VARLLGVSIEFLTRSRLTYVRSSLGSVGTAGEVAVFKGPFNPVLAHAVAYGALLVPDPDPEDEPWIGDRFCSQTGEGSSTAKRSVVGKADVRGKFTAELVAQT
jgi:hypothetical protein